MDKRNATSSWSGYFHQGKVGIFISLIEIHNCLNASKDYSHMTLEYESAEDIDIKEKDNILSRHQVKAYKNAKYPNDYAEVLSIQEYRCIDGKKTLVKKGFQVNKYDDFGNFLEVEVAEDARHLHVVSEVEGFDLDRESFKIKYPKANFVSNPNKIKLFKYPDGNEYCNLTSDHDDKIKNFCMNEIKAILTLHHHPYKDDDVHQEELYCELLDILDNKIRIGHMDSSYPIITFSEIVSKIICLEKKQKQTVNMMRKIIIETWEQFILEMDCLRTELSEEHREKVECIIKSICCLDDEKMIDFLKNLNPDSDCIEMEILPIHISKICSEDALKDIFYELLTGVKSKDFIAEKGGYTDDGGYLVTLINRNPAKVSVVIEKLLKNRNITKEIFNKRFLINGQIDGVFISSYLENSMEISAPNWPRDVTKNDIFYLANMQFIQVNNAINKLEGEG